MSIVLYPFFLRVQISLAYKKIARISVLYTFNLEHFWAKFGLRVLFRIPGI
jgi:hypothetical protein